MFDTQINFQYIGMHGKQNRFYPFTTSASAILATQTDGGESGMRMYIASDGGNIR